jgi:hypothetical protein
MTHFSLDGFIRQHPYDAVITLWIFSNLVLTMPPPELNSPKWYKWLFGFLHSVGGAIPRVAANFLPPDSFLYKLLAGGNGGSTNSTASAPISTDTKVDGAPPKA